MRSHNFCLMQPGETPKFSSWPGPPLHGHLPSNLGLTVGPNIDYVLVKTFNPYTHLPVNVVLAKALIGKYFKPEGENGDFENYTAEQKLLPWKILAEFKGKDLEGLEYEQLLPYEANSLEAIRAITPDAQPFPYFTGRFCNHRRWYRYCSYRSCIWRR